MVGAWGGCRFTQNRWGGLIWRPGIHCSAKQCNTTKHLSKSKRVISTPPLPLRSPLPPIPNLATTSSPTSSSASNPPTADFPRGAYARIIIRYDTQHLLNTTLRHPSISLSRTVLYSRPRNQQKGAQYCEAPGSINNRR